VLLPNLFVPAEQDDAIGAYVRRRNHTPMFDGPVH
jgi:hypothetical protein